MIDKAREEYRTLSTEISKVLSDRTNAATSDRISLRDAVCAYVAAERATGTTLHSVIQRVKEILKKAEEEAASATDATERRDDGLAHQLVVWCMEFHHTPDLARVP
jgi:ElaB/YqjD/DUF883 family membrane-anchored ribosome-binding protein